MPKIKSRPPYRPQMIECANCTASTPLMSSEPKGASLAFASRLKAVNVRT